MVLSPPLTGAAPALPTIELVVQRSSINLFGGASSFHIRILRVTGVLTQRLSAHRVTSVHKTSHFVRQL